MSDYVFYNGASERNGLMSDNVSKMLNELVLCTINMRPNPGHPCSTYVENMQINVSDNCTLVLEQR